MICVFICVNVYMQGRDHRISSGLLPWKATTSLKYRVLFSLLFFLSEYPPFSEAELKIFIKDKFNIGVSTRTGWEERCSEEGGGGSVGMGSPRGSRQVR